ncbi:enoyl-CoA hydratase/isomerase family protein [Virgibacillus senegalensis]|uniref:enoyl-CoA hydratase/isomerase family protein n=1 Tax=Virgibacillus senegalensis TaxID=1499679 RepID=UPI00069F8539|nr:enoyl-CoA hydratase/isomerase family protein [Virgibacillus senegalensis]
MDFIEFNMVEGHFAVIRLQRPEKHHAVSLEMAAELNEALSLAEQAIDQAAIKCLIVTSGESPFFCAGGDLGDFHVELSPEEAFNRLNQMRNFLYRLFIFPLPTIALLNGDALGGGCEIATACDERFASGGRKFGFIQSKLGITPGWGGGALLYHRILPSHAFRWLSRGEIYSAKELVQSGWLHGIYSEEKSLEYFASPFLTKSTDLLRLLKKQYLNDVNVEKIFGEMEKEVKDCASLWDSPEHIQAIEAFHNQRKK